MIAFSLDIEKKVEEEQHFVVLKRKAESSIMTLKKFADGSFATMSVVEEKDRRRRIQLMIKDRLGKETIEGLLQGKLTEDEDKEFFR
jgi:hypothetical protein